jgi:hypothetical protein
MTCNFPGKSDISHSPARAIFCIAVFAQGLSVNWIGSILAAVRRSADGTRRRGSHGRPGRREVHGLILAVADSDSIDLWNTAAGK